MTPTERDDLNKRIAEDLGWKRVACPSCDPHNPAHWQDHDGNIGWPNAFTDPACTLLLMGKIHEQGYELRSEILPDGTGRVRLQLCMNDDASTSIAPTIGEAVALAYLAMRKLK